ncbi:MAG: hypothetical protein OEY51_09750 [Cyclobacteriaceae bacterium]|nr:hypothetical protein [Cyclobacteriaceae bacterium]
MEKGYQIIFIILFVSCGPYEPVNETPYIPFDDIFLNLSLPEFSGLQYDGGAQAIDGGVRGIILYRESSTSYHAYERNCTYLPNDACATVNIDDSGLYMNDACCGSIFDFISGYPMSGPAFFPLQKYKTYLSGGVLTITDEVIQN